MNRLRYFCTIAQAGSLTKASELLNISQPALSKACKLLEHEVGQQLLLPSGRGIAITDYGQKLLTKALPLIKELDKLTDLNQEEPKEEILKIATFEVFSTYFLGQTLANDFPKTKVELIEAIPGEMEQAILNNKSDIGITYLPIPHPDLDILKITQIEMNIYGQKKFLTTDFNQLNFVVPVDEVSGSPSKVKGLDGWPDHDAPRHITHKVGMMETALDLARRGFCVGYFPDMVIHLHNKKVLPKYRLVKIKKPKKIKKSKQDVFMIKRKSDIESKNFKRLARTLRMVVSQ